MPKACSVSCLDNVEILISLFDQTFYQTLNTRLVRGDHEPVYLPANAHCCYHQIIFAHGFFSSALHEVSHWCLAGAKRRMLEDFGYWYVPDGRDAQQQAEFEKVEVKPQALEWIFSRACRVKFQVSIDNLGGELTDVAMFKRLVYRQVLAYCEEGLPARAEIFHRALVNSFQPTYRFQENNFQLCDLTR